MTVMLTMILMSIIYIIYTEKAPEIRSYESL